MARPVVAAAGGGDGGGDRPSDRLLMSPQLREAIRVLQLARLELIAEIRREIDTTTTDPTRP